MAYRRLTIPSNLNDVCYAYRMDPIKTKIEGRGSGIKTLILNCNNIARDLRTQPQYITKFLGIDLGALSKYDERRKIGVVCGQWRAEVFQQSLDKFITEFILCTRCRLPELQYKIHKAKGLLLQRCASCGWKGVNQSTHKAKAYIIKHPPPGKIHGPDYYKHESALLGSCRKFKSVKDHFDLLFHGFIRAETVRNVERLPTDVLWYIFSVCYDTKKVKESNDCWSSKIVNYAWKQADETIIWRDLMYNHGLLKSLISYKIMRQLWTFRILNVSQGFKIELIQYDKSRKYRKENMYKYELFSTDEDDKYGLIKYGGLLQILFVNDENEPVIKIKINDWIENITFDATDMNLKRIKYRLALILHQGDEIRLLPQ